ncbi:uncharacterized protein LOC110646944 [Hevea brasiliensis]|uniref:uncharacterized protein LOC110646944 n=1 Tax=Hevea brasiliensis TaxID=3981 RepID=UPI0025E66CEC|nr:uncharacterized protein LOC110646944 [Hevea brasiliensis]
MRRYGETILHLCVKDHQLDALKFLLERINDDDFVNLKDGNDITALQLETKVDEQHERNCYTALDILNMTEEQSEDFPEHTNDITSVELDSQHAKANITYLRHQVRRQKKHPSRKKSWLEQKQSALMVVASLIATMAFQAAIGVWQEDLQMSTPESVSHSAGHSIMADKCPRRYTLFVIYNTTSFLSSISVILLLISGLPFGPKFFMWILMVIVWIAITSSFL